VLDLDATDDPVHGEQEGGADQPPSGDAWGAWVPWCLGG
jgi:hypothetical protein